MAGTIEEHFKELALKSGADVVGIASVEEIDMLAPPGHRPGDILQGARSVIVTGVEELSAGSWRSPSHKIQGFNLDYFGILRNVSVKLGRMIEKEYGHYAVWFDGGSRQAGYNPFISIKLCAELAGLGTRALAGGIILNPDHGLCLYSCVFTTMPLKPDGPMQEDVCPHPDCVRMWEKNRTVPCLKACPQALAGEIRDGKIERMRFNRLVCATRAQNYSLYAFQKMMDKIFTLEDPVERKTHLFGSFFQQCLSSMVYMREHAGVCFECTRDCPYQRRAVKLTPKVRASEFGTTTG